MSDDTEKTTSVVTDILTRKPARPLPHKAMEQAMKRAHELSGESPIRVSTDETSSPLTPEDELDMDLHVDGLERRLEAVEGKLTVTLVVLCATVLLFLANLVI